MSVMMPPPCYRIRRYGRHCCNRDAIDDRLKAIAPAETADGLVQVTFADRQ